MYFADIVVWWCGCIYYWVLVVHQQGPTNICNHITTHRWILIGYFNNCNFSNRFQMMVWLHGNLAELFNVNFKTVFKTIYLVNKKSLIISRCTVCIWKKKTEIVVVTIKLSHSPYVGKATEVNLVLGFIPIPISASSDNVDRCLNITTTQHAFN